MCLDIGMRDEEKLSGTLSENSINHSSKVD